MVFNDELCASEGKYTLTCMYDKYKLDKAKSSYISIQVVSFKYPMSLLTTPYSNLSSCQNHLVLLLVFCYFYICHCVRITLSNSFSPIICIFVIELETPNFKLLFQYFYSCYHVRIFQSFTLSSDNSLFVIMLESFSLTPYLPIILYL